MSGSLLGNPCLFTGQRYDVETGFYWCKTRYLDPQSGRFTTRDPIGLWGDPLNLGNGYSYAGNNPWTLVDAFGLCGKPSDDFDEEWWGNFLQNLWDMYFGDPLDSALDFYKFLGKELLGFGSHALADAYAYGPGLLGTIFDQLLGLYNMGQLAWNDPGALYDMAKNGLGNWLEGWFDPYQAGWQGWDLAVAAGTAGIGGPGATARGATAGLRGGARSAGQVLGDVAPRKAPPIWTPSNRWSPVENAYNHFKKHGADFPGIPNAKQYVDRARQFFDNPPEGSWTKTRPNGDTLRYDPNTNTFGVQRADGAPRTMFKPRDGVDYWGQQ